MRIIAGRWRGRRIRTPAGELVRPTADRVREAWMSIVHLDLPDARVLDLYAGSGALGLEALSRGARHVDFVDSHPLPLRTLAQNIETLAAADRVTVHRDDVARFVSALDAEQYDVAFADPPYQAGHAVRLAELWLTRPFARLLGVEHESFEKMPAGGTTRRYGTTSITFYRLPEPD